MKRYTAVLVAAILMLAMPMIGVSDAGGDLTQMTMDELLSLRRRINEEISGRYGMDSMEIFTGRYVAGEGIAVGRYIITCTDVIGSSMVVMLSEYNAETKRAGETLNYAYLSVGETAYMDVAEGTMMEINDGVGIIKTVDPYWAP